ncbi:MULTISPECIES: ankyrin repeat domain-containing protein, partial [unclassified Candidatus Cardinium]|uniref:ankyrin repeat domain-containing protein n=1 Tax=unclassified Candidatus Cardinium TaxID=2641185 RepID=UPI001FB3CCD0
MHKKHIQYTLLSKLMTGLSLVLFLVVAINCCKLPVRYGLNEDSTNLKKENKAETKTLKDLVNLIINYLPILAKDNMLFATDNQGRNIIHHAVLSNHIDILKILLENSISDNYHAIFCLLNAKDHDGYTPLQLATKNGKVEAVKLLSKDVRVDVNKKTKYGASPLCIASYLGHVAVVR